jgi:hypothetical protein
MSSPNTHVIRDPYLGAVEVRKLTAVDADEIAAEADRRLPRALGLLRASSLGGASRDLRERVRGGLIAAGAIEAAVVDETVLRQLGIPDGDAADPDVTMVGETIARLGLAILDLSAARA